MIVTNKEQIDKVVGAYKHLLARRRAAVIKSQEKQAELAAKEKEQETAKAT